MRLLLEAAGPGAGPVIALLILFCAFLAGAAATVPLLLRAAAALEGRDLRVRPPPDRPADPRPGSARRARGRPAVTGGRGPGPAGGAQPPGPGRLTPEQLAVIGARLAELAGRIESIRQRLAVLEAAVQSSRGSTICSTRDSRSSTRPRSS